APPVRAGVRRIDSPPGTFPPNSSLLHYAGPVPPYWGVSVMKRFIKPTTWAVVGALVLALVAVAARRRGSAGTVNAAPPPPEVAVLTVAPETVAARYEYVGQAEASRAVEVRSQVTGVIVARPYEEGTDVPAGAAPLPPSP